MMSSEELSLKKAVQKAKNDPIHEEVEFFEEKKAISTTASISEDIKDNSPTFEPKDNAGESQIPTEEIFSDGDGEGETILLTVNEEAKGERLDSYVAEMTSLSRSAAAKLIEGGNVLMDGKRAKKRDEVKCGSTVHITLPPVRAYEVVAEEIPLDVIYEDSDIIVINKPSGMVVHPAPGNYSGTLVNALLYHCRDSLSGIGGVMRPGIVHRIDKDTSGLLVVAKNDEAHRSLSEELKYHGIVREYHALVKGGFSDDGGTVDMPIGRHPEDRKRMAVFKSAGVGVREAVTHYSVLRRYDNVSYLKLVLETGRTHQIRVHMAHLGHPLIGDAVYCGSKNDIEKRHPSLIDGQMLHAARLELTHPRSGERMKFECPLPDNFKKLVEILEAKAK